MLLDRGAGVRLMIYLLSLLTSVQTERGPERSGSLFVCAGGGSNECYSRLVTSAAR